MKKSKKYIVISVCLLLALLMVVSTVTYLIDPLFQYHTPWFGLEACVTDGRYQNAGIAKNFDFENVLIGNSMSENFFVSDVEGLFGGSAVKLTAPGSHVADWGYLLNLLEKRKDKPKHILFNFDAGFIEYSPIKTQFELPTYLYDDNWFNDINYLFNFSVAREYTLETVKANVNDSVSDYDTVFVWGYDYEYGKGPVKEFHDEYFPKQRAEKDPYNPLYVKDNMAILEQYFKAMPDTQFVFFGAPFSVLYWETVIDEGNFEQYQSDFAYAFDVMSQYDNVTLYFWTDPAMMDIMCDLDNYKDATHYSLDISKELVRRMKEGIGVVSKEEAVWEPQLNAYFDYLKNYDYQHIFD